MEFSISGGFWVIKESAMQDGVVDMLHELAGNLWWSWHGEVRSVFRSLDPRAWPSTSVAIVDP